MSAICLRVHVFVFPAASRWGREGRLGVRLPVREVPPEGEEDGQLQKAQVEVSHGAAGEDRTCSHLRSWVFSGTRTLHKCLVKCPMLEPQKAAQCYASHLAERATCLLDTGAFFYYFFYFLQKNIVQISILAALFSYLHVPLHSQSSIEDKSDDKSITTTFGVNRPTISCFFDCKTSHNSTVPSVIPRSASLSTIVRKSVSVPLCRWHPLPPALLPVPS